MMRKNPAALTDRNRRMRPYLLSDWRITKALFHGRLAKTSTGYHAKNMAYADLLIESRNTSALAAISNALRQVAPRLISPLDPM